MRPLKHLQNGMALLGLMLAAFVSGWLTTQAVQAVGQRHSLKTPQNAQLNMQLQHATETLVQFGLAQGSNSHTHRGHLPCPASTPGGLPAVRCEQANLGFWPQLSDSKTNYLRNGLPLGLITSQANEPLRYAVSPKLLAPNTLGWSGWYDPKGEPLWLSPPNGGPDIEVAAVVGFQLTPAGKNRISAHGAARWVSMPNLLAHIDQTNRQDIQATLQRWRANHSEPMHASLETPQIRELSANTWAPNEPNCQCRCTKTRCTCHCDGTSQWVSAHECQAASAPHCEPLNNTKIGQSFATQCDSPGAHAPCIFLGAAGMLSLWPISRYEPIPTVARACQPQNNFTCPGSQTSEACTCRFGWPSPTNQSLGQLVLEGKPQTP